MLKKNLLSLILALCLCMTLAAPAWASDDIQSISIKEMFEEAVNSPQPLSETESISCTTMLTNEDGDAYLVNMYEYLPARIDDGENKSRTFVYSTEEDYITPYTNGLIQTNTSKDNSLSVFGTITVTYNEYVENNSTYAMLIKVTGGWERQDRSVAMKDREVVYCSTGAGTSDQVTIKYPTSDSFTYYSGYLKYANMNAPGSAVAAQSYIDLSRGTSSSYWTLTTRANVYNSELPFPFNTR